MAVRGLVKLHGLIFVGNHSFSRCLHLQKKVVCHRSLACLRARAYCTSSSSPSAPTEDLSVWYENGLPVLLVPLPSRYEMCQFMMRPLSNTLSDLVMSIQQEDGGVDRVAAYTPDGTRIAQSTPIDILLQTEFILHINDRKFTVKVPEEVVRLHEDTKDLAAVKTMISQLYSSLNVEEHQLARERDLLTRLEELQAEIAPLEQARENLAQQASKRTNQLAWLGLGLMSLQFGILARLTWWEYSWDIMEPVTYFVTYGTTMAMFAYYVLTKQEYVFPEVRDRQFLLTFHKNAKKQKFNLEQYNRLRDSIAQAEQDLLRLRDPLQLQLPIQQLQRLIDQKQKEQL